MVVFVEVDAVKPTVSVDPRDLASVVFEHVDDLTVSTVVVEVRVGLVGDVDTDTVAPVEDRHRGQPFRGRSVKYSGSCRKHLFGRPLAGVSRRQVVVVDVGRETGVVTEVGGVATVLGTVTDADRVVVEDT